MNPKVLVIDDDPAIHLLVGVHLAGWRTELHSAYDGESGLALARDRAPDLVLLDVDLPDLNGHDVLRRMKSDPVTRPVPVLFLSADCSTHSKVTGLDMGAVDYVAKPFDPFELRARSQVALRARRQLESSASRAMIDEGTGLYNRAFFERYLRVDLARARRSERAVACVLVELDDFDGVVENFGHPAAEKALRGAALALEFACREGDVVCRYADDQFAVLAFDAGAGEIGPLTDRLLAAVASRPADEAIPTLGAACGWALSSPSGGRSIAAEAEDALALARYVGGPLGSGAELTHTGG